MNIITQQGNKSSIVFLEKTKLKHSSFIFWKFCPILVAKYWSKSNGIMSFLIYTFLECSQINSHILQHCSYLNISPSPYVSSLYNFTFNPSWDPSISLVVMVLHVTIQSLHYMRKFRKKNLKRCSSFSKIQKYFQYVSLKNIKPIFETPVFVMGFYNLESTLT